MAVEVRFTVRNDNPSTVWNRLVAKLGRDPTSAECRDEIFRILDGEPPPSGSRMRDADFARENRQLPEAPDQIASDLDPQMQNGEG